MSWDVDDGDDEVYDQDGAVELFVGAPAHAPSVDGFDDVIIGQPGFDATNGGEGRAMIGLSTRDVPE